MFCADKLVISLIPHQLAVDKFEIIYDVLVAEVVVSKAITRHVCIDVNSRMKQELTEEMIHWLETNSTETAEGETTDN